MERYKLDSVVATSPSIEAPSMEATKLIRKLRWIGLIEEASRLQRAANTAAPKARGILGEIPYSTD